MFEYKTLIIRPDSSERTPIELAELQSFYNKGFEFVSQVAAGGGRYSSGYFMITIRRIKSN